MSNAIRRWDAWSSNMEIDWNELPGVSQITWPIVNGNLRLTMHYANGQSAYFDVSPQSTQEQMESFLDQLYKYGLQNRFIQLRPDNVPAPSSNVSDIEAWFNRQPDWMQLALGVGGVIVAIWAANWYGSQVTQHVEADIAELRRLNPREAEIRLNGMYRGFYQDPVHDVALRTLLFVYGINDSTARYLYGLATNLSPHV